MSRDLTNLFIDETFQYLTQISGSNRDILEDGLGNLITELALTASHAVSASFATTASYALNSVPQVSSSYAVSASHALNADNSISSSYAVSALSSSYSNTSTSASHANVADTSISSSYALTASYMEAEDVMFDDTNFAYTASNVQVALQRLSDNKADISQLTSNVNVYPTTTASDVSGYVTLVTSSADIRYNATAVDVPTGTISGSNQFIAALITDGALFTGDPGIVNITTVGQVRRTGGGSNSSAAFNYEVYKRSGSVETLIATSDLTSEVNEEHYEEFSAAAILNNGTFTSDDRIVIKYYGSLVNPQGADPSFEFQFGGDTPIRTLFPVPATVLVSPWNGQFTGDAGITGSLTVTEGITGSLQGNADTATSASYALTASYALNAGGDAFPYTGSAEILGDLTVKGVIGSFTPLLKLEKGTTNFSFGVNQFPGFTGSYTSITDADEWKITGDTAIALRNDDVGAGNKRIDLIAGGDLHLEGGNKIDLITGGDIDIKGKAFAYTTTTNINGFTQEVNQTSIVRDNQRAFVETPLIIGNSGTITVGTNSTLKVINEL